MDQRCPFWDTSLSQSIIFFFYTFPEILCLNWKTTFNIRRYLVTCTGLMAWEYFSYWAQTVPKLMLEHLNINLSSLRELLSEDKLIINFSIPVLKHFLIHTGVGTSFNNITQVCHWKSKLIVSCVSPLQSFFYNIFSNNFTRYFSSISKLQWFIMIEYISRCFVLFIWLLFHCFPLFL